MKKITYLLLPLFFLISSPGQAEDKPTVTPTGFLSDYTRLIPDETAKDNYFHYTAPEDLSRKLGKIYFLPVATFPIDATFKLVDRPTIDQTMAALDQILRKKITDKATLVATPEEADTTIQIVVTAITTEDASRSLIDFVPLRLLTKPLKDAAMGKEQEVVVTLEMSIRDAKTNQILFEAVHRSAGKNIGRADDADLKATEKDLSPVIDIWTNKIVREIITPKL
jgi:hypothetical protein